EIINADSVQIYRGFDIGASKPGPADFALVPHHLYSCVDPRERFDAAAFSRAAERTIAEVCQRQHLPLIVGGTGFYIRALISGLVPISDISEDARKELAAREEALNRAGVLDPGLYEWLTEIDAECAATLHPADIFRIRRAILVRLSTGESIRRHQAAHRFGSEKYRALVIVLLPERAALYRTIDQRIEQMLSSGLVEEVEKLRQEYPLNSHPFGAIGYRHVSLFLDGLIDYPQMVHLLKRDTRRFAKRQMTWWRNQPATAGWKILDRSKMGEGGVAHKPHQGEISGYLLGVIRSFLNHESVFDSGGVAVMPLEQISIECMA
ncbi:MAG TPA: tRNA (adenosine(37)-N6)-dimethylallyltransferase MiaA, partial [Oligoflexia bacterium]|nr:tRNA (adenosine(37)-N6)-dimethylallyltransferase MiaA [Oligoflexia bacterium]